ncbi:hypothetical protein GW17_00009987 [Ensete ventricosum]|nr:hypothetical protein GW17_00009987 [Ensete ventricosum]RZR96202.1 hypothetical protein BHM03_00025191 [Ensete ventricosum]
MQNYLSQAGRIGRVRSSLRFTLTLALHPSPVAQEAMMGVLPRHEMAGAGGLDSDTPSQATLASESEWAHILVDLGNVICEN